MNKVNLKFSAFQIGVNRWTHLIKKNDLKENLIIIFLLRILLIIYLIFTLPGSFLEGSFCYQQKKMKIGLSIIGYFLLFVGCCMIAPILVFWNLIPDMSYFKVVIFIGKLWDALAILGIVLMIASFFNDFFRNSNILKRKKNLEGISWRLRTLFRILHPKNFASN